MISALPEKRGEVELNLVTCRQYLEDLEELSVWCISTRDFLLKIQDGRYPGNGTDDITDPIAATKVRMFVIILECVHRAMMECW